MSDQMNLFDDPVEPCPASLDVPVRVGRTRFESVGSSSILTKASGFMAAYDYTLNPYSGCSFGCSYCYAAFFTKDRSLQDDWGNWVKVKSDALGLLERMRTDLNGARVYMSSVTDPYQPIERRLGLVRSLLPVLASKGVRLVVQTRSPLVERDIDLLTRFGHARVNMTVTTDSTAVQRAFEPRCPTNARRLRAITKVMSAGIDCSITMTPLLPVEDPDRFADQLLRTGVTRFVVQPFHAERGRFVAGTGAKAKRLVSEMGWTDASYRRAIDRLRERLPHLDEGQEGFAPV